MHSFFFTHSAAQPQIIFLGRSSRLLLGMQRDSIFFTHSATHTHTLLHAMKKQLTLHTHIHTHYDSLLLCINKERAQTDGAIRLTTLGLSDALAASKTVVSD